MGGCFIYGLNFFILNWYSFFRFICIYRDRDIYIVHLLYGDGDGGWMVGLVLNVLMIGL